jgi:S1-C subfamily serine protease
VSVFVEALAIASKFTYPYVGLRRRANGETYASVGAFVLVNDEGWALTSAHVVGDILGVEQERLGNTPAENPITDHVEIWALPGFAPGHPTLAEAHVRPVADIALVRFDDADLSVISRFPALRDEDHEPVSCGMSVCRLGYPFHDIGVGFDDDSRQFQLPGDAFPVPSFALDGVVARFRRVAADDGSADALFIETSTPGLRGQSGGPLLDVAGRVCGIQSHTSHLDLGFDAHYTADGQLVTERQFLNVGAATHVSEIRSLLDEAGVRCALG